VIHEAVAKRFQRGHTGAGLFQAAHGNQQVNHRLGGQAWHGCAADMMDFDRQVA